MSGTDFLDTDLVSVIIPYYNNGHLLKDCISSIFSQNYPCIEIIVADDGSSLFPYEDICSLEQSAPNNIASFKILHADMNRGTVSNIEWALEHVSGEIVTVIAADDLFYSDDTFSFFVDWLHKHPEASFVTGQTEMWDDDLSKKLFDFVSDVDVEMLKAGDSKEIFERLSTSCIVPPVSFRRKSFFVDEMMLSSSYDLIEDWPTFLRMARFGIAINYADHPIIKHRAGGVSQGSSVGDSITNMRYLGDEIRILENEILPFIKYDDHIYGVAKRRHDYCKNKLMMLDSISSGKKRLCETIRLDVTDRPLRHVVSLTLFSTVIFLISMSASYVSGAQHGLTISIFVFATSMVVFFGTYLLLYVLLKYNLPPYVIKPLTFSYALLHDIDRIGKV